MPASFKSELLERHHREYEKLSKLIEALDADLAMRKDQEDTSIKDVIAHRAHWIDLFLGWYADGQAGRPVYTPAEGYKWNDLKRYNADLRQRQAGMSWAEAQEALQVGFAKLTDLIESLPDEALYGGPMKGAHSKWTTGRWAEAAGPSHFRSASKYIRAALKSAG